MFIQKLKTSIFTYVPLGVNFTGNFPRNSTFECTLTIIITISKVSCQKCGTPFKRDFMERKKRTTPYQEWHFLQLRPIYFPLSHQLLLCTWYYLALPTFVANRILLLTNTYLISFSTLITISLFHFIC